MNFEIPPGLTDLLQEFTVCVLRARPSNLEEFAARYFTALYEKKCGSAREGKSPGLGNLSKERERNSGEEDDDEPMPELGRWLH